MFEDGGCNLFIKKYVYVYPTSPHLQDDEAGHCSATTQMYKTAMQSDYLTAYPE